MQSEPDWEAYIVFVSSACIYFAVIEAAHDFMSDVFTRTSLPSEERPRPTIHLTHSAKVVLDGEPGCWHASFHESPPSISSGAHRSREEAIEELLSLLESRGLRGRFRYYRICIYEE